MRRASCVCVHLLFIILDDKAKATATCSKNLLPKWENINVCHLSLARATSDLSYSEHFIQSTHCCCALDHLNQIHCWRLFANQNNATRYVINNRAYHHSQDKNEDQRQNLFHWEIMGNNFIFVQPNLGPPNFFMGMSQGPLDISQNTF